MSVLLKLKSKEVRMVGIWGPSGIGKTTIARALFHRLSRHFQGHLFIDKAFLSESMKIYSRANADDYNMKLHLQKRFLSEILGKNDIKISHLGELAEKLKHQKVFICIDDLDDQVVLDALVGQTQWFGSGSRIIVVTNDKRFLRAHGIDHVYEVCLPSEDLALEMFCRYAFKKNYPPDDSFMWLASQVVSRAGKLPLAMNVLGLYLRGRDKEGWMDMMPRLLNDLDGKIEKTLRVSYDGLNNKKDEAIFRHIACLFNGEKVSDIKRLLANSDLDVNIGLKNLVDKSLVHVREDTVEMHRLLQDMGKEIVRGQSDEPGEREFIVDSKDICEVLENNTGTKKVIGILLNILEIDELNVHESAFKSMRNLCFLTIGWKRYRGTKKGKLQLPERFNYLPHSLKLLCWPKYPLRCLPSKFRPENLVKLKMRESNLEKLWEGVVSLPFLKKMDLRECHNLKEIPNLSMATNLEKLDLSYCQSLVELPASSIRNLNKLRKLDMSQCNKLETLPTDINLKSLDHLLLNYCFKLRTFPEISTNISVLLMKETSVEEFPSNMRLENLDYLCMENINGDQQWEGMQLLTPFMSMLSPTLTELRLIMIPNLVELPSSSFQYLHKLKELVCVDCINLEILPTGTNLESLCTLDLFGCSRLRTFPDISTNISELDLRKTGIEAVPWWVEKFSRLVWLNMESCSKIEYINLNMYKLTHLKLVKFANCGALARADLGGGYPSGVAVEADNINTVPFCPPKGVYFDFRNCYKLDPEGLLHQRAVLFKTMKISGEKVPSYFTHRTTGTSSSLTDIPLPHTSLQQTCLKFRVCAVVRVTEYDGSGEVYMNLECRFTGIFEDVCSSSGRGPHMLEKGRLLGGHLFIWDCWIYLNKDDHPPLKYVDMKLHISSESHELEIKEWGIRVLGAFPLPDHREEYEDSDGSLYMGSETDQSEECEEQR